MTTSFSKQFAGAAQLRIPVTAPSPGQTTRTSPGSKNWRLAITSVQPPATVRRRRRIRGDGLEDLHSLLVPGLRSHVELCLHSTSQSAAFPAPTYAQDRTLFPPGFHGIWANGPNVTATDVMLPCGITPPLGFGRVWSTNPDVRATLGCALEPERAMPIRVREYTDPYCGPMRVFWPDDPFLPGFYQLSSGGCAPHYLSGPAKEFRCTARRSRTHRPGRHAIVRRRQPALPVPRRHPRHHPNSPQTRPNGKNSPTRRRHSAASTTWQTSFLRAVLSGCRHGARCPGSALIQG